MKTPILILCLISFTLPAQTNLNASPQKLVTAGYAAKSDGVVEIGMVELTGRKINKADSLTKCQGDCEITIHDIIVKADELDFHPDTGEAEARGNVRVKIMPHGAVAQ
jgi:lipopolysaccharide assembly outer membrane protein LptD (OstA)